MEYETKDSGERQQWDSGMQRDTDEGKDRWDLLGAGPMLRRWQELLTRGAVKYDPNNWTQANSEEEKERFRESAFRHFMAWYYGDTPEEDHGAGVFFNINGYEYTADRLRTVEQKINRTNDMNALLHVATEAGLNYDAQRDGDPLAGIVESITGDTPEEWRAKYKEEFNSHECGVDCDY